MDLGLSAREGPRPRPPRGQADLRRAGRVCAGEIVNGLRARPAEIRLAGFRSIQQSARRARWELARCFSPRGLGPSALADGFGLPVSTTHVLSSGIAGTMTASGAGLRWLMVRNILLAWVFTLPAATMLSGGFYWLFSRLF